MSDSAESAANPDLKIAVVDQTHANEIPDNIDADLYTTTRPESSLVEFAVDPHSDLAEALRQHGYDA
jgi:hypothetical protein